MRGPVLKAAITVMQAKIDCLMKPAAPSLGPDLTAQLDMSPALFGILSQQLTDVRLNGKLKAAFSRPPGAAGLDLENLSRDLAALNLDLVAKDNRPAAAGSVSLNLSANHPAASNALTFKGSLSDSTNHPAVTFNGTRDKGRMDLAAQLDIDPTHFAQIGRAHV